MIRLVIANRGEIARRILRTARKLGLEVAVISTADDADALVRREADAVLEVPDFLDAAAVVAAARDWGAELLHPGYGFLSERADFAEAVEAAGIAFVGPTPEAMRLLGAKEPAKALARSCGVPVVEGLSSEELAAVAPAEWGALLASRHVVAPFLVKASGGGGGRGMRVVATAQELPEALATAAAEAQSAFGDGTVFVERWIPEARHVEAQVFGDGQGGGVFLGERECSLQRRHQKVLEESPACLDDPELREDLGRSALALVRAARYRGAGTVEFLVGPDGHHHFLEVNARLQVEHPVTEQVTGLDLVAAQLELAQGRWPPALGDPATFRMPLLRGVAVEARILAEDPASGFLPTPGRLSRVELPEGEGLRVDTGVASGSRVNGRYDSLVAKVIAWGPTRAQALDRLAAALGRTVLQGCTTNVTFLRRLVEHPVVRSGAIHTRWLEAHAEALVASDLPAELRDLLDHPAFGEALSLALAGQGLPVSPAAGIFAGLRDSALSVGAGEAPPTFTLRPAGRDFELRTLSGTYALAAGRRDREHLEVTVAGETRLLADPRSLRARPGAGGAASGEVKAPMAGRVVSLCVAEGDTVEVGQALLVLESMKLRFDVAAPRDGVLQHWLVAEGQVLGGPEAVAVLA